MSEEGKNIIIDFTEKEESIYKFPGDLVNLKVTGNVSVINPSDRHRLWNTMLFLKGLETVKSELVSEMKIGELSPNTKWTRPYEVKSDEMQTKTLLKLTEVIDTYYEKGVEINWALVKNHRMPTSFTITLENNSEKTISNIKLVKQLPEFFGPPIIDPPAQGTAKFDPTAHTIIWDGFNLVPGGVQSLIMRVGFEPDRIEPYPTGKIEVDYIVNNITRSKFSGNTKANSDSMFAVDQGESLEEPGEWECTAEFENMSDFLVELESVTVSQVLEARKETILQEALSIHLPPNKSWAKDFRIKSGVVPKFSNVHVFNIVPKITSKVVGHITYEPGVLPVAHIEPQKILNPPDVSAYTKTPIQVSLIVTNAGSAVLNELTLRDTLPADFKPPELSDISIYIGEEELRAGVIRELEPNDTEAENSHILTVKVGDLMGAGGLQPNEQLLVTYPMQAWDPKPKVQYLCPLDVSANVAPPGPPVKVPTCVKEVEVKYVRRRIRAYKGQTPGAEPGEFIIPIVFENKGEVVIEKIILKDIIPHNFSLLDWNPKDLKPEMQETAKGTQLIWKISKADPGEKIQFSYTIKGSGEYEREELEVIVG
ncbi:MAG TPA: hypothetical protein VMV49_17540 [Candidatus Deferrimicrobium sp.]|nr:hypothetical protein [Candidatus Deferrimicrobium sp.]